MGGVMDEISGIVEAVAGADSAAVERMKVVRGAFLVAEAVVQAVLETARAVASFAEQDYTGGAMHVIAAALYTAAAIKAGVEMGVSSKSGSTSASAGSGASGGVHYPERGSPMGPKRPEPTPTIVNINNGNVTSNRVNEDLQNLQADSSRRHDQ
jgi:hypothetical protein